MSSRAKQQPSPAVGSRRTRRAEPPRSPAGLAESPHQIVSNPIFRCEAGPSQPNSRPPPGDQLRCVYRPGSLYALVHDPAASAAPVHDIGTGKAPLPLPLPLPPCRAHPSVRVGPAAHAVGGPHGRVLRRGPPHDPFLAAYVACSKSATGVGGKDAAGGEVDRPQHKQRRRRKKKKKAEGKKCKEGEVIFRGCGIWSGWAGGAMSCRYGCAVAGQKGDDPAIKAKSEDDAPAGPTLDLSWTPVVLSARALERREQRC